MQPQQPQLNEFERAILEQIAQGSALLLSLIGQIHVVDRELSGCGTFTKLGCRASAPGLGDQRLGLDQLISVPTIPNGLGAVLFCKEGKPALLEIYTFGDDEWDGAFDGFRILNHQ